jgi:hypothetical protein
MQNRPYLSSSSSGQYLKLIGKAETVVWSYITSTIYQGDGHSYQGQNGLLRQPWKKDSKWPQLLWNLSHTIILFQEIQQAYNIITLTVTHVKIIFETVLSNKNFTWMVLPLLFSLHNFSNGYWC